MPFNSIDYFFFIIVLFSAFWMIPEKNIQTRKITILLAGYSFYFLWSGLLLFLLMGLNLFNYFISVMIIKSKRKFIAKLLLWSGLFVNLSNLIFFKYFNFFIISFKDMILGIFNYEIPLSTLNIIIPAGISFYTFIALSYLIDSYKNKFDKIPDITSSLISLSFFPIVISGPIERPVDLIPKINKVIKPNHLMIKDGMRQILWGIFVKVVIADNINPAVENIFSNYNSSSGSTLILGAFLFSIQIYADFSGYSEIAIGTSKLFGIEIIRNFSYPYFAKDITDFWKRWHISLTLWFRDYVFLPLALFLSSRIKKERLFYIKSDLIIYGIGIIITWALTGFWHGANYTFIVWGMLHAALLFIYKLLMKPRKILLKKAGIKNSSIMISLPERIFTLSYVSLAWIFFKSASLNESMGYIAKILSSSIFTFPHTSGRISGALLLSLLFIFIEFAGRNNKYAIQYLPFYKYRIFRWSFYYVILASIYYIGNFSENVEFIYFQF